VLAFQARRPGQLRRARGEPHRLPLLCFQVFYASVHHLWLHLGDKTEEEDDDVSDDDAKETTKKSTSNTSALRWQLLRNHVAELKKEKKKSRQNKSPVDWRALYRSHGIHRSVVDMASLDAYHELRKTYLHSSVNGYEYELFCFARFIGLHEFCSNKGIEQLTWIDADIPIFDPVFLDRVCLPLGYSIWALNSGRSFLKTMTCLGIGRFCRLYARLLRKGKPTRLGPRHPRARQQQHDRALQNKCARLSRHSTNSASTPSTLGTCFSSASCCRTRTRKRLRENKRSK